MPFRKHKLTTQEHIGHRIEREGKERWRLRDIKGDRHVVHPGFDERLGFGGQGASLTTRQIIKFAYKWFPEKSFIVIGSHSGPDFSEMVGGERFMSADGEIDYKQFLLAQKAEIERAKIEMATKYPRQVYPQIIFGLEADIGTDQLWPPVEVLTDPQVGLQLVTASFHYERIPENKRTGEYF